MSFPVGLWIGIGIGTGFGVYCAEFEFDGCDEDYDAEGGGVGR